MSWSKYYTEVDLDDVYHLDRENVNADDQFDHAKEVVWDIIDSGVVGDPEVFNFNITMSGHSNPDHKPAENWANDCVSISVSQGKEKQ